MIVDYERAWARLAAYVASKPDHGSRQLALEMNRVLGECEVPESNVARDLRLLGGSVAVEVDVQTGGETADPGGTVAHLPHRSPRRDDGREERRSQAVHPPA